MHATAQRTDEPATGGEGGGRAQVRGRRRWLAIAALGALVAIAAVFTYQLALARVPHHRAAIERVVRAYTGLDLRFATLELRWGWQGPEAIFSQVELREPQGSPVRVRARQLAVGFSSWSSVRRGQLQISRVTLVGPDIDLTRLDARERRLGDGSGTPARRAVDGGRDAMTFDPLPQGLLDPRLLALLRRAPLGRIELESGTLRLRDARSGGQPVAFNLRTAQLRRTSDSVALSGFVFLPERTGRSVYLALNLKGDLADRASLEGGAQVVLRRAQLATVGDWLGYDMRDPRLSPLRSGSGDLSLRLEVEHGVVQRANGELALGGLDLSPGVRLRSSGAGAPSDWRALRGTLAFERATAATTLVVRGLTFASGADTSPASELRIARSARGDVAMTLDRLPADLLLGLVAWADPRASSAARVLSLDGEARALRVRTFAGADAANSWLFEGTLAASSWRLRSSGMRLEGVDAHLRGDPAGFIARLEGGDVSLHRANESPAVTGLALTGTVAMRSVGDDWRLQLESVRVATKDGALGVDGTLAVGAPRPAPRAVPASADTVAVALRLSPVELSTSTFVRLAPGDELHALAARVRQGVLRSGEIALDGAVDASGALRIDRTRGDVQIVDASWTAGTDAALARVPPIDAVSGRLTWNGDRWRFALRSGRALGLDLEHGSAEWRPGSTPRVSLRARGSLTAALDWAREHPEVVAVGAVAGDLRAGGGAVVDFDAWPRRVVAGRDVPVPRWRVAAMIEGVSLQVVSGLPALESLGGTWLIESGTLRSSTLRGRWLGGPVTLRLSQVERGASGVRVRADGVADAQQLARLWDTDAPGGVSGEFAWHAEWRRESRESAPAGVDAPARLEFTSNLVGLGSTLPAPFDKVARDALPTRVTATLAGDATLLNVRVADLVDTQLRFASSGDEPKLDRGAIVFGGGAAALPERAELLVQGRVDAVDLVPWFAAWPSIGGGLPDSRVDVVATSAVAGGATHESLRIVGRTHDRALELELDSPTLAGRVHWPADASPAHPARVQLARAVLPALAPAAWSPSADALGVGRAVRVEVADLSLGAQTVGRASATLTGGASAWTLRDLHATRPGQDISGDGGCELRGGRCRLAIRIDSRDAAATLRDLGLRPELAANEARLDGDLEWIAGTSQPWLTALTGRIEVTATDGTLALPPLATLRGFDAGFTRLTASFRLEDGAATTEDLHVETAGSELLMRGRVDLAPLGVDQQVLVLRGRERLPTALHQLGGPRVAAAWLALRDRLRGDEPAPPTFRLHGPWDAPEIEPVAH